MKNWMKLLFLAFIAAAVFTGCAKNPKLQLTGINDAALAGGDGEDATGNGFGEPQFDPFQGGGDTTEIGETTSAGIGGDWNKDTDAMGGAQQYLLNPTRWKDKVYFAYNRSDIRPSERRVLEEIADYLQKNADLCLVVEGHTDERGSDEYNRALGEHRALAAQNYLEKLGVSASRIFTISYGEDRPAVPNANGEGEWKLNRRDEFLVGKRK